MSQTGTVRLHRVLRAPAERVFRAFSSPDALAKWLPPFGFTGIVHSMDFTVGGTWRMSFRNMTSGNAHAFGGTYVTIVPNESLSYTSRFDDPNLPGEMTTTITLRAISLGGHPFGTEITAVQEGIPAVIPTEACYLGWQESLVQLAQLVEPTIPG